MGVLRSVYIERVRSGLCGDCGQPAEPDPRGGFYSRCRKHRAAETLCQRRRRARSGKPTREYRCSKCREPGHCWRACDIREGDLHG